METNMLANLPNIFPDLSRFDDYAGVVELWASTDFLKLTGVAKDILYKLEPRPRTCYSLFATVMEDLAIQHSCRFWLQKTSPFYSIAISENVPNAVFVAIRRGITDVIRSQIGNQPRTTRRILRIAKETYLCAIQEGLLRKLDRKRRLVASTTYEELRVHKDKEVKRICSILRMEFIPGMTEVTFRPNTSFPSESDREKALKPIEENCIRLFYGLLRLLPTWFLCFIRTLFRRRRRPVFVPGTFGFIWDDLHPDVKDR